MTGEQAAIVAYVVVGALLWGYAAKLVIEYVRAKKNEHAEG